MSDVVGRRPGPRVDVDVPRHLVTVAEGLYATEGIESVSLRAVARQAGVAPAAVSYHFASKEALISAVLNRREVHVGSAMRQGLLTVIESPGDKTVRDLVEAVALPMVELIDADPVGGLSWVKVFSQLALADHPLFIEAVSVEPSLSDLFIAAQEKVLPDADTGAVRRIGLGVFSMINALAGVDRIGYGEPLGEDGRLDPDYVEQLLLFTVAGISLGR